MYFIIKGKSENLKRLKGKNISELAKNLESEGWPSEFASESERDKIKWLEKKLERPATKKDIQASKLFPKNKPPTLADVEKSKKE